MPIWNMNPDANFCWDQTQREGSGGLGGVGWVREGLAPTFFLFFSEKFRKNTRRHLRGGRVILVSCISFRNILSYIMGQFVQYPGARWSQTKGKLSCDRGRNDPSR